MTKHDISLHFIGIGSQKAGTTWLWTMLKEHPDVWMPPIKEIHYFDRDPQYPLGGIWLSKPYLIQRLLNNILRKRTIGGIRSALSHFRQGDSDTCRWLLRYYLGTYNDNWYLSLFQQGKDNALGEITPDYSILNHRDVLYIKNMFPYMKVIFILRDPIERAWSHARYDWTASAWTDTYITDITDLNRVKQFLDSPGQELRSNYLRTLQIWESLFPKEQIFVGFFEDIASRPDWFFTNICNFLDIKTVQLNDLKKTVNASKKRQMPLEIELHLAQKYHKDIVQLNQLYGGYTEDWIKRAENVLQAG